jgi:hypothetical protein
MADVLVAPSASTMTMLPHQDPYQGVPAQSMGNQRIVPRPARHSMYYGQQIPQYGGFHDAPVMRPDPRAVAQLQRQSMHQYSRVAHPDSGSSTTSTVSTSSNHSARYAVSKDDLIVGMKQRSFTREPRVSGNAAATVSSPDLSLANGSPEVKSPDRYRRLSKRFDNASIQQPDLKRPMSMPLESKARQEHLPLPAPRMQIRTSSYDDSMVASRYKRRSLVGRPESVVVAPAPVTTQVNASALTWSQVVAGGHNVQGPLPPPGANRSLTNFRPVSVGNLRGMQNHPGAVSGMSVYICSANFPRHGTLLMEAHSHK